jgi:hypothetical protein
MSPSAYSFNTPHRTLPILGSLYYCKLPKPCALFLALERLEKARRSLGRPMPHANPFRCGSRVLAAVWVHR